MCSTTIGGTWDLGIFILRTSPRKEWVPFLGEALAPFSYHKNRSIHVAISHDCSTSSKFATTYLVRALFCMCSVGMMGKQRRWESLISASDKGKMMFCNA